MSETFSQVWSRRFKRYGRSIRKRLGNQTMADARQYVGTNPESGKMQLQVLLDEGLTAQHRVLEIGCGCLSAGAQVIAMLPPGHYAGIEPNEWLIETAKKAPETASLIQEKRPRFLHNVEFDASSLNEQFDFALSHSILSHAAHAQLKQFLENVGRVMAPGGKIAASIYVAEGNAFGNGGHPTREDSMAEEWLYPGITYFKRSTIEAIAAEVGLRARLVPEYTKRMVSVRPDEVHDWFIFER